MRDTRIGTAIAGLVAVGIGYVGVRYLTVPLAEAPGFVGSGDPDPATFLGNAKGVRDLASGIVLGGLLVTGRQRAAGWFMTAAAMIPTGDALVVLANAGSTTTAFGIHGATAVALLIGGGLLRSGADRADRHAAGPVSVTTTSPT